MEFAEAASGFTRLTLGVLESAGVLLVTVALGASLAAAFGLGRLVERASRELRQPAAQGRSTHDPR
jgi:hypothetical protein